MMTITNIRKRIKKGESRIRIDWTKNENILCSFLADYGFHGDFIGDLTGLTRAQVYYRLRQCGKSLRDYRNGKTLPASIIIRKYRIVSPTMRVSTFTPQNLYPKKAE